MTDKQELQEGKSEYVRSPEEQKRLDEWEALPEEERTWLKEHLVGDVIAPDGKPIFGPSIFEDPSWAKYFKEDDDDEKDGSAS